MKILIAGINGYMGTALYAHLKDKGHTVCGFDNNLREKNIREVGGDSVTIKNKIPYKKLDATDYDELVVFLKQENPDTVIWLAEQPSAPFSMIDLSHAKDTLANNEVGTMNILYAIKEVNPKIHLIKLGTEGEYPDWIWNGKHIPEGNRIKVDYRKKISEDEKSILSIPEEWEIPTPRYFSSWYHYTKFAESYMLDYANRIWGLTITDVNQGIIFGHRNGTRLDIDNWFGTVVHRFVAQAVLGLPLTIFGKGGQTRGMICLQNSLEALRLLSENPPKKNELRVIHQTTREYSVLEVAKMIREKLPCELEFIENPRVEMESNKFTFDTSTLKDLGLEELPLKIELDNLIGVMKENKERIIKSSIRQKSLTKWKNE